jgi:hypothetical protein
MDENTSDRQKQAGKGLSTSIVCSCYVVMLHYPVSHSLLRGVCNVSIVDFSVNHVTLKVNDEAIDAKHEQNDDGLDISITEDNG